jgi:hypothetical protein
VDEGWWEFEEKHYSASLTADMHLVTDEKAPTADGMVTKSGYGVNVSTIALHGWFAVRFYFAKWFKGRV